MVPPAWFQDLISQAVISTSHSLLEILRAHCYPFLNAFAAGSGRARVLLQPSALSGVNQGQQSAFPPGQSSHPRLGL